MFFLLIGIAFGFLRAQTAPYTWSPATPLATPRQNACAVLLPDGRALIAGGEGPNGVLGTTEIYQPDGTFVPGPSLLQTRKAHTCTVLGDGRVLVAGGVNESGLATTAEILDAAATQWVLTASAGMPRFNHTATLMAGDKVLLAGGETATGPTAALEWFDPVSTRIDPLNGSLSTPKTRHAAALAADGSVLISGGWDGFGLRPNVDRVYADGSLGAGSSLPQSLASHTMTALLDGRMLIVGGQAAAGDSAAAWFYDPSSGQYQAAGTLKAARSRHQAFLLPDNGNVVVIGGEAAGTLLSSTELFDTTVGSFQAVGALLQARRNRVAVPLLRVGQLLAAGGSTDDGIQADSALFASPALIFDKRRYSADDPLMVRGTGWQGATIALNATLGGNQQQSSMSGDFQTEVFGSVAREQKVGQTLVVTGRSGSWNVMAQAAVVTGTTTALTIDPPSPLTRQMTTIAAVVQPGDVLGAFDGVVRFYDGAQLIGVSTAPVTDDGGTGYFLLTTELAPGARNLTATFEPVRSFFGSSAADPVTIPVSKRPTTTSLAITPAFPRVGDPVSLVANVVAGGSPQAITAPSGKVTFASAQGPVGDSGITAANSYISASGAVTLTAGAVGSLKVRTSYAGDAWYEPSTSDDQYLIAQGVTTLTATTPKLNYVVGEAINVTVTLKYPSVPNLPATGKLYVTQGTPGFSGNTKVPEPNQVTGTVVTNLPTATPPAGRMTFDVFYSGDSNFSGSQSRLTLLVDRATPTITFQNPGTVSVNDFIVLNVTITPPPNLAAPRIPDGFVELLNAAGATVQFFRLDGNGKCTFTLPPPGIPGVTNYRLRYDGDENYAGTISSSFAITAR